MSPAELELALSIARENILSLQSRVESLESLLNLVVEKQMNQQIAELKTLGEEFLLQDEAEDDALLQDWRRRSQFAVLKAMLFESADKLGRTKEVMEAEFGRRWKMLLDANFRKLEDSDPSRAARADKRAEDERPEY